MVQSLTPKNSVVFGDPESGKLTPQCKEVGTSRCAYHDISKKAQRIKGLIRPYISQKAIKLLKCIIMIIWAYSGPHFNPKAI